MGLRCDGWVSVLRPGAGHTPSAADCRYCRNWLNTTATAGLRPVNKNRIEAKTSYTKPASSRLTAKTAASTPTNSFNTKVKT